MSRKSKKPPPKKTPRSSGANKGKKGWADVAIRMIDALYDLAQTGNLIGLFVFGFVCWIFYITYKLPPEFIESAASGIGIFLTNERFYFFPLVSVLIVSVITNIIQAKVYKSHIQDLTEQRSALVHGLQTGELTPLKTHRSSGFDVRSGSVGNGTGEV